VSECGASLASGRGLPCVARRGHRLSLRPALRSDARGTPRTKMARHICNEDIITLSLRCGDGTDFYLVADDALTRLVPEPSESYSIQHTTCALVSSHPTRNLQDIARWYIRFVDPPLETRGASARSRGSASKFLRFGMTVKLQNVVTNQLLTWQSDHDHHGLGISLSDEFASPHTTFYVQSAVKEFRRGDVVDNGHDLVLVPCDLTLANQYLGPKLEGGVSPFLNSAVSTLDSGSSQAWKLRGPSGAGSTTGSTAVSLEETSDSPGVSSSERLNKYSVGVISQRHAWSIRVNSRARFHPAHLLGGDIIRLRMVGVERLLEERIPRDFEEVFLPRESQDSAADANPSVVLARPLTAPSSSGGYTEQIQPFSCWVVEPVMLSTEFPIERSAAIIHQLLQVKRNPTEMKNLVQQVPIVFPWGPNNYGPQGIVRAYGGVSSLGWQNHRGIIHGAPIRCRQPIRLRNLVTDHYLVRYSDGRVGTVPACKLATRHVRDLEEALEMGNEDREFTEIFCFSAVEGKTQRPSKPQDLSATRCSRADPYRQFCAAMDAGDESGYDRSSLSATSSSRYEKTTTSQQPAGPSHNPSNTGMRLLRRPSLGGGEQTPSAKAVIPDSDDDYEDEVGEGHGGAKWARVVNKDGADAARAGRTFTLSHNDASGTAWDKASSDDEAELLSLPNSEEATFASKRAAPQLPAFMKQFSVAPGTQSFDDSDRGYQQAQKIVEHYHNRLRGFIRDRDSSYVYHGVRYIIQPLDIYETKTVSRFGFGTSSDWCITYGLVSRQDPRSSRGDETDSNHPKYTLVPFVTPVSRERGVFTPMFTIDEVNHYDQAILSYVLFRLRMISAYAQEFQNCRPFFTHHVPELGSKLGASLRLASAAVDDLSRLCVHSPHQDPQRLRGTNMVRIQRLMYDLRILHYALQFVANFRLDKCVVDADDATLSQLKKWKSLCHVSCAHGVFLSTERGLAASLNNLTLPMAISFLNLIKLSAWTSPYMQLLIAKLRMPSGQSWSPSALSPLIDHFKVKFLQSPTSYPKALLSSLLGAVRAVIRSNPRILTEWLSVDYFSSIEFGQITNITSEFPDFLSAFCMGHHDQGLNPLQFQLYTMFSEKIGSDMFQFARPKSEIKEVEGLVRTTQTVGAPPVPAHDKNLGLRAFLDSKNEQAKVRTTLWLARALSLNNQVIAADMRTRYRSNIGPLQLIQAFLDTRFGPRFIRNVAELARVLYLKPSIYDHFTNPSGSGCKCSPPCRSVWNCVARASRETLLQQVGESVRVSCCPTPCACSFTWDQAFPPGTPLYEHDTVFIAQLNHEGSTSHTFVLVPLQNLPPEAEEHVIHQLLQPTSTNHLPVGLALGGTARMTLRFYPFIVAYTLYLERLLTGADHNPLLPELSDTRLSKLTGGPATDRSSFSLLLYNSVLDSIRSATDNRALTLHNAAVLFIDLWLLLVNSQDGLTVTDRQSAHAHGDELRANYLKALCKTCEVLHRLLIYVAHAYVMLWKQTDEVWVKHGDINGLLDWARGISSDAKDQTGQHLAGSSDRLIDLLLSRTEPNQFDSKLHEQERSFPSSVKEISETLLSLMLYRDGRLQEAAANLLFAMIEPMSLCATFVDKVMLIQVKEPSASHASGSRGWELDGKSSALYHLNILVTVLRDVSHDLVADPAIVRTASEKLLRLLHTFPPLYVSELDPPGQDMLRPADRDILQQLLLRVELPQTVMKVLVSVLKTAHHIQQSTHLDAANFTSFLNDQVAKIKALPQVSAQIVAAMTNLVSILRFFTNGIRVGRTHKSPSQSSKSSQPHSSAQMEFVSREQQLHDFMTAPFVQALMGCLRWIYSTYISSSSRIAASSAGTVAEAVALAEAIGTHLCSLIYGPRCISFFTEEDIDFIASKLYGAHESFGVFAVLLIRLMQPLPGYAADPTIQVRIYKALSTELGKHLRYTDEDARGAFVVKLSDELNRTLRNISMIRHQSHKSTTGTVQRTNTASSTAPTAETTTAPAAPVTKTASVDVATAELSQIMTSAQPQAAELIVARKPDDQITDPVGSTMTTQWEAKTANPTDVSTAPASSSGKTPGQLTKTLFGRGRKTASKPATSSSGTAPVPPDQHDQSATTTTTKMSALDQSIAPRVVDTPCADCVLDLDDTPQVAVDTPQASTIPRNASVNDSPTLEELRRPSIRDPTGLGETTTQASEVQSLTQEDSDDLMPVKYGIVCRANHPSLLLLSVLSACALGRNRLVETQCQSMIDKKELQMAIRWVSDPVVRAQLLSFLLEVYINVEMGESQTKDEIAASTKGKENDCTTLSLAAISQLKYANKLLPIIKADVFNLLGFSSGNVVDERALLSHGPIPLSISEVYVLDTYCEYLSFIQGSSAHLNHEYRLGRSASLAFTELTQVIRSLFTDTPAYLVDLGLSRLERLQDGNIRTMLLLHTLSQAFPEARAAKYSQISAPKYCWSLASPTIPTDAAHNRLSYHYLQELWALGKGGAKEFPSLSVPRRPSTTNLRRGSEESLARTGAERRGSIAAPPPPGQQRQEFRLNEKDTRPNLRTLVALPFYQDSEAFVTSLVNSCITPVPTFLSLPSRKADPGVREALKAIDASPGSGYRTQAMALGLLHQLLDDRLATERGSSTEVRASAYSTFETVLFPLLPIHAQSDNRSVSYLASPTSYHATPGVTAVSHIRFSYDETVLPIPVCVLSTVFNVKRQNLSLDNREPSNSNDSKESKENTEGQTGSSPKPAENQVIELLPELFDFWRTDLREHEITSTKSIWGKVFTRGLKVRTARRNEFRSLIGAFISSTRTTTRRLRKVQTVLDQSSSETWHHAGDIRIRLGSDLVATLSNPSRNLGLGTSIDMPRPMPRERLEDLVAVSTKKADLSAGPVVLSEQDAKALVLFISNPHDANSAALDSVADGSPSRSQNNSIFEAQGRINIGVPVVANAALAAAAMPCFVMDEWERTILRQTAKIDAADPRLQRGITEPLKSREFGLTFGDICDLIQLQTDNSSNQSTSPADYDDEFITSVHSANSGSSSQSESVSPAIMHAYQNWKAAESASHDYTFASSVLHRLVELITLPYNPGRCSPSDIPKIIFLGAFSELIRPGESERPESIVTSELSYRLGEPTSVKHGGASVSTSRARKAFDRDIETVLCRDEREVTFGVNHHDTWLTLANDLVEYSIVDGNQFGDIAARIDSQFERPSAEGNLLHTSQSRQDAVALASGIASTAGRSNLVKPQGDSTSAMAMFGNFNRNPHTAAAERARRRTYQLKMMRAGFGRLVLTLVTSGYLAKRYDIILGATHLALRLTHDADEAVLNEMYYELVTLESREGIGSGANQKGSAAGLHAPGEALGARFLATLCCILHDAAAAFERFAQQQEERRVCTALAFQNTSCDRLGSVYRLDPRTSAGESYTPETRPFFVEASGSEVYSHVHLGAENRNLIQGYLDDAKIAAEVICEDHVEMLCAGIPNGTSQKPRAEKSSGTFAGQPASNEADILTTTGYRVLVGLLEFIRRLCENHSTQNQTLFSQLLYVEELQKSTSVLGALCTLYSSMGAELSTQLTRTASTLARMTKEDLYATDGKTFAHLFNGEGTESKDSASRKGGTSSTTGAAQRSKQGRFGSDAPSLTAASRSTLCLGTLLLRTIVELCQGPHRVNQRIVLKNSMVFESAKLVLTGVNLALCGQIPVIHDLPTIPTAYFVFVPYETVIEQRKRQLKNVFAARYASAQLGVILAELAKMAITPGEEQTTDDAEKQDKVRQLYERAKELILLAIPKKEAFYLARKSRSRLQLENKSVCGFALIEGLCEPVQRAEGASCVSPTAQECLDALLSLMDARKFTYGFGHTLHCNRDYISFKRTKRLPDGWNLGRSFGDELKNSMTKVDKLENGYALFPNPKQSGELKEGEASACLFSPVCKSEARPRSRVIVEAPDWTKGIDWNDPMGIMLESSARESPEDIDLWPLREPRAAEIARLLPGGDCWRVHVPGSGAPLWCVSADFVSTDMPPNKVVLAGIQDKVKHKKAFVLYVIDTDTSHSIAPNLRESLLKWELDSNQPLVLNSSTKQRRHPEESLPHPTAASTSSPSLTNALTHHIQPPSEPQSCFRELDQVLVGARVKTNVDIPFPKLENCLKRFREAYLPDSDLHEAQANLERTKRVERSLTTVMGRQRSGQLYMSVFDLCLGALEALAAIFEGHEDSTTTSRKIAKFLPPELCISLLNRLRAEICTRRGVLTHIRSIRTFVSRRHGRLVKEYEAAMSDGDESRRRILEEELRVLGGSLWPTLDDPTAVYSLNLSVNKCTIALVRLYSLLQTFEDFHQRDLANADERVQGDQLISAFNAWKRVNSATFGTDDATSSSDRVEMESLTGFLGAEKLKTNADLENSAILQLLSLHPNPRLTVITPERTETFITLRPLPNHMSSFVYNTLGCHQTEGCPPSESYVGKIGQKVASVFNSSMTFDKSVLVEDDQDLDSDSKRWRIPALGIADGPCGFATSTSSGTTARLLEAGLLEVPERFEVAARLQASWSDPWHTLRHSVQCQHFGGFYYVGEFGDSDGCPACRRVRNDVRLLSKSQSIVLRNSQSLNACGARLDTSFHNKKWMKDLPYLESDTWREQISGVLGMPQGRWPDYDPDESDDEDGDGRPIPTLSSKRERPFHRATSAFSNLWYASAFERMRRKAEKGRLQQTFAKPEEIIQTLEQSRRHLRASLRRCRLYHQIRTRQEFSPHEPLGFRTVVEIAGPQYIAQQRRRLRLHLSSISDIENIPQCLAIPSQRAARTGPQDRRRLFPPMRWPDESVLRDYCLVRIDKEIGQVEIVTKAGKLQKVYFPVDPIFHFDPSSVHWINHMQTEIVNASAITTDASERLTKFMRESRNFEIAAAYYGRSLTSLPHTLRAIVRWDGWVWVHTFLLLCILFVFVDTVYGQPRLFDSLAFKDGRMMMSSFADPLTYVLSVLALVVYIIIFVEYLAPRGYLLARRRFYEFPLPTHHKNVSMRPWMFDSLEPQQHKRPTDSGVELNHNSCVRKSQTLCGESELKTTTMATNSMAISSLNMNQLPPVGGELELQRINSTSQQHLTEPTSRLSTVADTRKSLEEPLQQYLLPLPKRRSKSIKSLGRSGSWWKDWMNAGRISAQRYFSDWYRFTIDHGLRTIYGDSTGFFAAAGKTLRDMLLEVDSIPFRSRSLLNSSLLSRIVVLIAHVLALSWSRYFIFVGFFVAFFKQNSVRTIGKAAAVGIKPIFITILFFLVVLLIFTIAAFTLFAGQLGKYDFGPDDDRVYDCNHTFGDCLMKHIDMGFRNVPVWVEDSAVPVLSQLYSFIFWFFSSILVIVMTGIIIDGFSELRETQSQVTTEVSSKCFICRLDRGQFAVNQGGFKRHVRVEHNMWAYVAFRYYLEMKSRLLPTELTGTESYILSCIRTNSTSYFPVGQATSIQHLCSSHDPPANTKKQDNDD